ncbi:MAG: D-hexose-6-phosphate mutarotase [Gammaproteobacteria bacterium]
MNIDRLNARYGIADVLQFRAGQGGLPRLEVANRSATASVSLFGGQVLSYKPDGEQDMLFLSRQAVFDGRKAIRGGIPICWPWFGAAPDDRKGPNHGFARTSLWQVRSTEAPSDYETKIELTLDTDAESRTLWPHACELRLSLSVGSALKLELTTCNTGDRAFSISEALHSYFRIADIDKIGIAGLTGNDYHDKIERGKLKQQAGELKVTAETDRIYLRARSPLTLKDPAAKRCIGIDFNGGNTAVVWNPWLASTAAMADLDNDDYRRFICIEPANACPNTVSVAAGGEHTLSVQFDIMGENITHSE